MDTTERLHFHFSLSCIGEGNGNPLQCSCLKNPRDGGAWWAAVSGVAQSWTRLKRLSSSSTSELWELVMDKEAWLAVIHGVIKSRTRLSVFTFIFTFTIIFTTSTIVCAQVKQQRGNTVPSKENWIKDLLSMAPHIRTRPSVPLSQYLPSGSFHKSLILIHQWAGRMKTTVIEN